MNHALYQIQATVAMPKYGGTLVQQVPTFKVDALSAQHAASIARTIVLLDMPSGATVSLTAYDPVSGDYLAVKHATVGGVT